MLSWVLEIPLDKELTACCLIETCNGGTSIFVGELRGKMSFWDGKNQKKLQKMVDFCIFFSLSMGVGASVGVVAPTCTWVGVNSRSRSRFRWFNEVWIGYRSTCGCSSPWLMVFHMVYLGQRSSVKCAEDAWNYKVWRHSAVYLTTCVFTFKSLKYC